MKNHFKKRTLVVCAIMLLPILNLGSVAHAKRKTPPKAFSFIAEGGKASQGECDGERKIPKLKRLKEFANAGSYMGSELQSPEIPGRSTGEMWKHFFRIKSSCNMVLAKTPSSIGEETLKKPKADLPPEEDIEEPENPEPSGTADSE